MKTLLVILFFLSFQISNGQTAKDYFNKEVKQGQDATTDKIMTALESGDIKSVRQYFATEIKNLETLLETSSKDINKVKDKTKLSTVIVYHERHNIYRCRYYNDSGELFQIDFHFEEGNPNSKVVKLETKTLEILKKEREERMKSNQTPPPPPMNN